MSFRDHSNNRELFDVTLRLLVNLTNPELLLFKVCCLNLIFWQFLGCFLVAV